MRSILCGITFAVLASFVSCSDGNPPQLGGSAFIPCAGRVCGQECTLCSPSDPGCVEIAVQKFCNASGECDQAQPSCGGSSFDPCAGKSCGERCTECAPDDPDCFEAAVVKSCDNTGRCVPSNVSCGG